MSGCNVSRLCENAEKGRMSAVRGELFIHEATASRADDLSSDKLRWAPIEFTGKAIGVPGTNNSPYQACIAPIKAFAPKILMIRFML